MEVIVQSKTEDNEAKSNGQKLGDALRLLSAGISPEAALLGDLSPSEANAKDGAGGNSASANPDVVKNYCLNAMEKKRISEGASSENDGAPEQNMAENIREKTVHSDKLPAKDLPPGKVLGEHNSHYPPAHQNQNEATKPKFNDLLSSDDDEDDIDDDDNSEGNVGNKMLEFVKHAGCISKDMSNNHSQRDLDDRADSNNNKTGTARDELPFRQGLDRARSERGLSRGKSSTRSLSRSRETDGESEIETSKASHRTSRSPSGRPQLERTRSARKHSPRHSKHNLPNPAKPSLARSVSAECTGPRFPANPSRKPSLQRSVSAEGSGAFITKHCKGNSRGGKRSAEDRRTVSPANSEQSRGSIGKSNMDPSHGSQDGSVRRRREHRAPRPMLSRGISARSTSPSNKKTSTLLEDVSALSQSDSNRKEESVLEDISDAPLPPSLSRGVTTGNTHLRRGNIDANSPLLPRSMREKLARNNSEKHAASQNANRKVQDSGVLDADIMGYSKPKQARSTGGLDQMARAQQATSRKPRERIRPSCDKTASGAGQDTKKTNRPRKPSCSRTDETKTSRDRSSSAQLLSGSDEENEKRRRSPKSRRERDRSASAGLLSDSDDNGERKHRSRKPAARKVRSINDRLTSEHKPSRDKSKTDEISETPHENHGPSEHRDKHRHEHRGRRSPRHKGGDSRVHTASPMRGHTRAKNHYDITRSQFENVVKNYDPETALEHFENDEEEKTVDELLPCSGDREEADQPCSDAADGEKKGGLFALANKLTKTAVSATKSAAATATQTASKSAKLGAKVASKAAISLGVSSHHGSGDKTPVSMSQLGGALLGGSSSSFGGDDFAGDG